MRFLNVTKRVNYKVIDAVDRCFNQTGIEQNVSSVLRHNAPLLGQFAHCQLWLPTNLRENPG